MSYASAHSETVMHIVRLMLLQVGEILYSKVWPDRPCCYLNHSGFARQLKLYVSSLRRLHDIQHTRD